MFCLKVGSAQAGYRIKQVEFSWSVRTPIDVTPPPVTKCHARSTIHLTRTSPTTYICSESHRRRLRSSTDRSCAVPRTTLSATGASLSPGHVFGTVFRPTCATRTLRTAVSGVNSKRFVLMLLPGRNETFVNCAI